MENKLTAEQMEKLKACKTIEEAKALAEKENIELTDEQLEDISGGVYIHGQSHSTVTIICKNCGRSSYAESDSKNSVCPFCGCDCRTKKGDITYDKLF